MYVDLRYIIRVHVIIFKRKKGPRFQILCVRVIQKKQLVQSLSLQFLTSEWPSTYTSKLIILPISLFKDW